MDKYIEQIKNSTKLSFRSKFLIIWERAIKAGMSSAEARDYASLELNNEYFHKPS